MSLAAPTINKTQNTIMQNLTTTLSVFIKERRTFIIIFLGILALATVCIYTGFCSWKCFIIPTLLIVLILTTRLVYIHIMIAYRQQKKITKIK